MEERQVMRISEVDLALSSLDILELDLVSLIDSTYRCRRDLQFSILPVKHLSTLSQRHMGAFRECFRRNQVSYVMLQELRFLTQLY